MHVTPMVTTCRMLRPVNRGGITVSPAVSSTVIQIARILLIGMRIADSFSAL
jgi:hypothetical protein